MVDINEYIIEKLKINKDVSNKYFVVGDKYLIVTFIIHIHEITVKIYPLYTLKYYNSNYIKYETERGKIVEKDIYKNDKGYYEMDLHSNHSFALIFNEEDALDFINKCRYCDNKPHRDSVFEFLDSNVKNVITNKFGNDYIFYSLNSHEEIERILDDLKEL